ncbi:MAG: glyoxalase/bleomycin resistance/dioxygenase family protein [Ideonella sp. MAG2]|nr:MAG: glyoxalase/bleomycin resistance/dioxygenase family protein [Ideonella sp. MAG2]
MKRFHVHLHVADLAQSIGFYSKLFATEPARQESDYAKWMLEDPPVNFAISTRGQGTGIDHLGIQTDNAEELGGLKARAQAAELALVDTGTTTCCYARSEKYWVTDPQGVAWEHFHTLGSIPLFQEAADSEGQCCTPATAAASPAAESPCCGPAPANGATTQASCSPRGKPLGIAVTSQGCC